MQSVIDGYVAQPQALAYFHVVLHRHVLFSTSSPGDVPGAARRWYSTHPNQVFRCFSTATTARR